MKALSHIRATGLVHLVFAAALTSLAHAQPTPPTVSTFPASAVGATNATLNGAANPWTEPTSGWFQWGTTTNYGNVTLRQPLGSGFGNTNFSQVLTGLTAGLTYHFRAVATNADGTGFGSNQSFTTSFFADINAVQWQQYRGSLAWGDYDNDGRLDLLTTGIFGLASDEVATVLYHNTGSNFTPQYSGFSGLPGVTGDTRSGALAWGDYDNDGWLDVVLAGQSSASGFNPFTKIMRGSGTGSFTDIYAGLPGVVSCSVAWGDDNNDGRADVLLSGFPERCEIWRNASPTFTNANAGMSGITDGAARWGDYDNDGRLDVLAAGKVVFVGFVSRLWRNTGGGVFTNSGLSLPNATDAAMAWADYDNDGRLDFLLTGYDGTNALAQVWHNTGASFALVPVPGLPGIVHGAVAWGDFDNDGRADFILTGATGLNAALVPTGFVSQVWRNTGGGFTNSGFYLPGVVRGSVAWGDYDNDGRLDFALMGVTATTTNGIATDLVTAIWKNISPTTNTPPTAPAGLNGIVTNGTAFLSWNAATDDHTPAPGLSYNLRVGTTPGGSDVVSPMSASNGLRRVAEMGNAQLGTNAFLNLPSGNYYWSVQAVDTAFAGGPFAAGSTFIVPAPRLNIARAGANANISWTPPNSGWILQESASLLPANWTNSPSGSTNPVTVPAARPTKFYRLFKP